LQQVNHELQNDMKSYSPSDYNKLLTGIENQNAADVKANKQLPTLDLYDGNMKGAKDSVSAQSADGSIVTAQGPVSPTNNAYPTPKCR
jgi:hypothetical protein